MTSVTPDGEVSVLSALSKTAGDSKSYYKAVKDFGGSRSCFYDESLGGLVVTGYEACQILLRDRHNLSRSRFALPDTFFRGRNRESLHEGYRLLRSMSIFSPVDGSYTQRRQRLLAILNRSRQDVGVTTIRDAAHSHINAISHRDEVDIFSTSFRPYASQCAMIALTGCSEVDDEITAKALTVADFFDGKRIMLTSVPKVLEAVEYLASWVESTFAISRLEDNSLVADLVLLYVAAHETLAYLLYVCLVALSFKESLGAYMCRDAIVALIDEALRFDSPVQISGRVVVDEFEFSGLDLHVGEKLFLHLGVANRDERVFESPDAFIEHRKSPSLSFGWGATRCIGSDFASSCAIEYISALLGRFSQVQHVAGKTRYDHGIAARGLDAAFFLCS